MWLGGQFGGQLGGQTETGTKTISGGKRGGFWWVPPGRGGLPPEFDDPLPAPFGRGGFDVDEPAPLGRGGLDVVVPAPFGRGGFDVVDPAPLGRGGLCVEVPALFGRGEWVVAGLGSFLCGDATGWTGRTDAGIGVGRLKTGGCVGRAYPGDATG